MGNTSSSVLSPLQRFQINEERRGYLVNGFCRCILGEILDYKQFDLNIISCIVLKHYDYTINHNIRSLSKFIPNTRHKSDNYYLYIALELSKMLIESHRSIRKQFKGATKKNGLKSNSDHNDKYYDNKLNKYVLHHNKLNEIVIKKMDFVGKSRGIHKSQPLCPCKTIDDYYFAICGDPTQIYNGDYRRCLSLADTTINDRGEVPFLALNSKKYDKLEFDNKRLNIWVHRQDMVIMNGDIAVPNRKLKFIRCLSRDRYNSTHCYWRLHCLKTNNNGMNTMDCNRMDENSATCIQYLGVVHNWRQRNGGHSLNDLLPEYYEYPCGRNTVWRKVEGVSFVSAHMALCYNEFCATLPQLNHLGQSSNEIKCKLIQSNSKIFWNKKFIKCIEKNIDYNDNKNEAKLIYYYTIIWLNQLIYKVALDHGFNFKKINKQYVAPHFYYKQNWNPLSRHFQKHIFKGRIKYYGKDIYFKNIKSDNDTIRIVDESALIQTIDQLLECLRLKLQNKNDYIKKLNHIKLTPHYKANNVKLIKV